MKQRETSRQAEINENKKAHKHLDLQFRWREVTTLKQMCILDFGAKLQNSFGEELKKCLL